MARIYLNGSFIATLNYFCGRIEYRYEVSEENQLFIKGRVKRARVAFLTAMGDVYHFSDDYTNQTVKIYKDC